MGYNDNEQSRQFSSWMIQQGYQNRVKAVEREIAERRQMHKQEENRERRRQQAKSHPVEIELTQTQSEGLLHVAFKPTKKQLLAKR